MEILINVGTMSLEVGKIKEAMDAFEEAIDTCIKLLEANPEGETLAKLQAMKITARFNVGFGLEE